VTEPPRIIHADCRDALPDMPDCSVDSVITDPPYALVSIVKRFGKPGSATAKGDVYARASAGFMGQQWDTGETAFDPAFWAEVLRVLKPGGHLLAFSGTRTYHRMACAIEDAGFEIRDQIAWTYGSGFPKSHDVSKAIDKAAGVEREVISAKAAVKRMIPGADQHKTGTWLKQNGRLYTPTETAPATEAAAQWEGWGTALKPAWEPICMARKPLVGTVAENVLQHGTGALNIDACRIATEDELRAGAGTIPCRHDPAVPRTRAGEVSAERRYPERGGTDFAMTPGPRGGDVKGRWPANLAHDGSDEVLAAFPEAGGQQAPVGPQNGAKPSVNTYGNYGPRDQFDPRGDAGSAARFFYTAKARAEDRMGSKHPTVKPVDLMRWLCKLVTPPGGTVLDPFAGSGSTGIAAYGAGFDSILVEREAEYIEDIKRRVDFATGKATHSSALLHARVEEGQAAGTDLPLFAGAAG
jgi:DNA modification methylase